MTVVANSVNSWLIQVVDCCMKRVLFITNLNQKEKPMEAKCKKCKLGAGGRICGYKNRECSGSNYKYFEPIEEKPMEKKYRVIKEFPTVSGFTRIGDIWKYHPGIKKYIDKNGLEYEIDLIENNPDWFEEVKEDTLESIIDNNFIGDEIKKNLEQCIVKQKIELLKEVLEFIPISYSDFINNKISELQKEITNGEKV